MSLEIEVAEQKSFGRPLGIEAGLSVEEGFPATDASVTVANA